jgi:release factor glutamine methyltransferase
MPTPPPVDNLEWTVLRVLQWAAGYLKGRGVESPRAAAEILLAHVLGTERVQLYVRHDQPLVPAELTAFKEAIRRRLRHEPVAYIVGRKGFWTLDLKVTPEVLIPRPETELLVEQALALLKAHPADRPARVLELGVGSGAVLVTLAREAAVRHRFFGCDVAPGAVAVAQANAVSAGVSDRVHLWAADWFAGLNAGCEFDLIVSNPPYVRSAEIGTLQQEITGHEPRLALDGGPDGLRSYRPILAEAHRYLAPGGSLLLEIGSDQRAAVGRLAEGSGCYTGFECRRDYAGLDRLVVLHKK